MVRISTSSKLISNVKPIAQAGLITKGIVYCLLGTLAFMSAFNINGQSSTNADKSGVLALVYQQPGGKVMLGIIALGLAFYSIWRGIEAFGDTEHKGKGIKGLAARGRYLFSGLIYASLSLYAAKEVFSSASSTKDSKQGMAEELFSKPYGQWLVGLAAAIFIGVGFYQKYYALSNKYKKHADKAGSSESKKALLIAGKIGYLARGIVWLIIGWLFIKAALNSSPSQAGDTSKALGFLGQGTYDPYLLGAVAIGLVCYGAFNFARAQYEKFT